MDETDGEGGGGPDRSGGGRGGPAQAPEVKGLNPPEENEPQRIVVSIPDRKLALLDARGTVIKTSDVAVGKHTTPTPTGSFKVVVRVPNPTYSRRGKVIGPGTSNPVGTRWLGLSKKHYGIHGTNVPSSIGHAASHGIRMRNRDVEELFELVRAERGVVTAELEAHGCQMTETARALGLERSHLYKKRQQLGIDPKALRKDD